MIFYYSGTGNSAYVAKKIAEITGDESIFLNQKIKMNDVECVEGNGRAIFSLPTYAWRIPRVVEEWIKKTEFRNVTDVWFIMNCGSEIGNAAKYNLQLCHEKGWKYHGTFQVIMPENYIAMFDAPDDAKAKQIIAKADPLIEQAAAIIRGGRNFPAPRNKMQDRMMSSVVNPIFYSMFVKANAFRVSDKCISCGKCEKLCPLNNIYLEAGKPVWGRNCTHCMACICYCPTEAIEYGKKSVGKIRYHVERLVED